MEKLLKNPLVIGGALIGAYYLLKKKPESRVGRTIGAVRDLGESVIDTTIDAGTDIISGVYETTQDIFGIYDNEELPSIDGNGIDGSDPTIVIDDENVTPDDAGNEGGGTTAEQDEDSEVDGSGFSGGTSRMSRGFSGEELDYNMEF
tara:strand:- start:1506 stop:1946 length:441 start_codon:yes stop_codon:yes gene_type:complete